MKTIKAFEYKDLGADIQARVFSEFVDAQVEGDLQALFEDLEAGIITEAVAYKTIGCSKSYAESTDWFVPACYYEHNEKQVKSDVESTLAEALFTAAGQFIQYKEGI